MRGPHVQLRPARLHLGPRSRGARRKRRRHRLATEGLARQQGQSVESRVDSTGENAMPVWLPSCRATTTGITISHVTLSNIINTIYSNMKFVYNDIARNCFTKISL